MTVAEILAQIDGLTPELQRAYLASIESATDRATLAEVEELLADENEGALAELLSFSALALFAEVLRSAYIAGGRYEVYAMPRTIRTELDTLNPAVTQWVSGQMQEARLIANDVVREAVIQAVADKRSGRSVKAIARDLLNRDGGGILGLPRNMLGFVQLAREQLLSGDPAMLREYLSRSLRDRRFDSIVHRSIETGKPIPVGDADKMVRRYAWRLLNSRTEMLAEHYSHDAFGAGRERAWQQQIENGLDPLSVTKRWVSRHDEKVRHVHREMNGQRVMVGQPFQGGGVLLRWPGDRSLGAGWDMTANCRCIAMYEVRL